MMGGGGGNKLGGRWRGQLLDRLRRGGDPDELVQWLVKDGVAPEQAERWVADIDDRVQDENRSYERMHGSRQFEQRARNLFLTGAFIFVGGVGLGALSFASARPGQNYFVPTGLIAGGLMLMARAKSH